MRSTRSWVLGMLAAVCCTSSLAAGVLKLSRTEVSLEEGKPANELWAENVGDSALYLDVTQQWVSNPGQLPERLVPVEEVSRPTLLALPGRLTLAPGQKYRMTLKVLDTPQQSQVWRLTFRPRERIAVDDGDMRGAVAPLFISVGYGVVIYQLAKNSH
ncbi:hypothetical protein WS87_31185 [Burkholderia sp. MSMB0856]|nr:hypothetical protein WS87_31185 [Burkholderia sp. MSMB0856]KVH27957.1 hypothetical protein WS87_29820 [Burkholderia sp. MSMB0856]